MIYEDIEIEDANYEEYEVIPVRLLEALHEMEDYEFNAMSTKPRTKYNLLTYLLTQVRDGEKNDWEIWGVCNLMGITNEQFKKLLEINEQLPTEEKQAQPKEDKGENIMNNSELQEVIEQLHTLYNKRDILDEEIEMKLLQMEDIIKQERINYD